VNDYRWFNPSQPQTLQMAVLLCYFSAFFGLLFGVVASSLFIGLFIIAGLAAGGFGIANEKRWGYLLAVSAAALHVLMYIAIFGSEIISNVSLLVSFVFDVALVVLLVHPMSRDYQRIWFK
jgi:ABC-type transport system involved in multi-copper enzyme maturation permease subunit